MTRDTQLRLRLQTVTKVQILRPTELWKSLDIRCAPPHSMVPAPDNSLSACRGKPYFAGPRPPLRLMTNDRIGEDVIRLTYVPA